MELVHSFEDDIYSVALHPTGLYAVIGFSDKLRYMTIMIDDLIMTKEFHIRSCRCVFLPCNGASSELQFLFCRMTSFSRLGHLFAAANGNVMQVYSSITFEQLYVLKGHNGIVRNSVLEYNIFFFLMDLTIWGPKRQMVSERKLNRYLSRLQEYPGPTTTAS